MDKRAWQATSMGSQRVRHMSPHARMHTPHTHSHLLWSKAMFPLSGTLCLFYWLPGSLPSHQGASLSDQDHRIWHVFRGHHSCSVAFLESVFTGVEMLATVWPQQSSQPLRQRCGQTGGYGEGADDR